MTRTAAALSLVLLILVAATGCRGESPAPAAKQLYTCPMHPQIVRDAPGDCPICSMTLVPRKAAAASGAASAGPATTGSGDAAVAGRSALSLSPDERQLLNVRSEPVASVELARSIRTVGRVAVDERRISDVHAKLEGYVEELHVTFTGQLVSRGEPLLSLYSPELLATQEEYLLALRARDELGGSGIDVFARGSADLVEASRQRLLRWDVSPRDIEEIGRSGRPRRALALHAGTSGYVIEKMAVQGMRVTPADTLFRLADLAEVWVLADVYEHELRLVELGTEATLTSAVRPGESWSGRAAFIAPTVDPATRSVKVRFEVDNASGALKPDMLVDVELASAPVRSLVLPEGSVIDAGDRRIVFVDEGEGRYVPREVELGAKVGGSYELVSGVAEGERVVTSANFLLDSESSLEAAFGAGVGETPPGSEGAP